MKDCNCYSEINEKVKERTEDPEAEMNYAFLFSGKIMPRITYTYRKKKKNGEFHNKVNEGTILPTFCPFCGSKYSTDN